MLSDVEKDSNLMLTRARLTPEQHWPLCSIFLQRLCRLNSTSAVLLCLRL